MASSNTFRLLLGSIIGFQLAVGPYAFALSTDKTPAPTATREEIHRALLESIPGGHEFLNPAFEMPKWGPFNKSNPVLDQNPYWLAGQSWSSASTNTSGKTAINRDGNGFRLQLPGSSRALRIEAPLTALVEADDYLFFQAPQSLFQAKTKGSGYGEGLFFIDKRDLKQESFGAKSPVRGVPVFFIPLEGTGWTEHVEVVQSLDAEPLLALTTLKGKAISFAFTDLDHLSKAYHLTLFIAVAAELEHRTDDVRDHILREHAENPGGEITLPYILPARGGTASFGMFATLINLDQPSHSIGEVASQKSLIDLIFPKAYALKLSQSVMTRLLIVGAALTATLVTGSTAAVFTSYGDRLTARRALVEVREDVKAIRAGKAVPDRTKTWYKIKAKVDDHASLFATNLTIEDFAPKLAAGYILEYGIHRFYGALDRQPHEIVQSFLKNTFLNDRANSEKIPVDSGTLLKGSLVLGSIDTALVIYELAYVNPVLMPFAGGLISPEMRQQMTDQYGLKDGALGDVAMNEAFRNGTQYARNGAYSLSASQRHQIMNKAMVEAAEELRSRGKNPADKANAQEYTKVLEVRIDQSMKAQGFPAQAEMIDSAPAMARRIFAKFGYGVDREKLGLEKNDETHFVLADGVAGDLSLVLKRAVRRAQELAKLSPSDPRAAAALEILEETRREFHVVYTTARNPLKLRENFVKAKRVRQMLSDLSYRADEDLFLPTPTRFEKFWKQADTDPEAAELSSKIFRQALFSVRDSKPFYLTPDAASVKAFAERSERSAPSDAMGAFALSNEVVRDIVTTQRREAIENYTPFAEVPRGDFGIYARAKARVEAQAERAVGQFSLSRHEVAIEPAERQRIYTEAYRKAYLEEVGLHAYSAEKSELVRACNLEVDEDMQAQMAMPEFQAYYGKLDWERKVKLLAHLQAEKFVKIYVKNTVGSDHVALNSPEQPGYFQRARQWKIATDPTFVGKTIKTLLRFGESFWADDSYKLDGASWRHRNIPFYSDMASAIGAKKNAIVPFLSVSYFVNYYVWQVHFTWPQALLLTLSLTPLSAANQWLNRVQLNVGIPAMEYIPAKIAYSLVWGVLGIPFFIPFLLGVSSFTPTMAAGTVGVLSCAALLSTVKPSKFWKGKSKAKAEPMSRLLEGATP